MVWSILLYLFLKILIVSYYINLKMAKNFSKTELNKCLRHAYGKYYPLVTLICFKIARFILSKYYILRWSVFNYKQAFFKILYKRKKKDSPILEFKIKKFEQKDDLIIKNFKKNGYVFIENFFDKIHTIYLNQTFRNFIILSIQRIH